MLLARDSSSLPSSISSLAQQMNRGFNPGNQDNRNTYPGKYNFLNIDLAGGLFIGMAKSGKITRELIF
jgi:hypothetical protein